MVDRFAAYIGQKTFSEENIRAGHMKRYLSVQTVRVLLLCVHGNRYGHVLTVNYLTSIPGHA